jgi:hypothetical protein
MTTEIAFTGTPVTDIKRAQKVVKALANDNLTA